PAPPNGRKIFSGGWVSPGGERIYVGPAGTLEEILVGPTSSARGHTNIMGALRHAMAANGYSDCKEFQRAQLVVTRR
ncbi:hypothetical protein R6G99_06800, partial [Actinotignum timonense]|nr:hypothetical protein [Actinotignum timonense]